MIGEKETFENIKKECERCLQCKNPRCISACPLNNEIPNFIKFVKENNLDDAREILEKQSGFSHICSYICYSKEKCMSACVRNKIDNAVNIKSIERFIVENTEYNYLKKENNGKKICVIGAGPAGISFSKSALLDGYKVDLYDIHEDLGGLLRYGIPRFRLPLAQVNKLSQMLYSLGINYISKEIKSFDDIPNYDYYVLATGTTKVKNLNISGEDNCNVIKWNEFLIEPSNYKFLKDSIVMVIGGGNVAIDCARTAKMLGSDVSILYRRSIDDMPCNQEELDEALNEGVKIKDLRKPNFITAGNNLIVNTTVMTIDGYDSSGRRKAVDTQAREDVQCDYIITAIGSEASMFDCVKSSNGRILVDDNFETNVSNVYAIGDCINGASTVTDAFSSGKKAYLKFRGNQ